jgi:hypothetical protein
VNARTLLLLVASAWCLSVPAQDALTHRARNFAALPNWSGIWETELSAKLASGEIGKSIADAAKIPNRPDFEFAPDGVLEPFELQFFRLVQLLQKPPYNAEWDGKYQLRVTELKNTPASAVNPGTIRACAQGFPMIMESPTDGVFQPFVTPEETLLLFADGEVRHIYTDGRSHPTNDDVWPTPMGDSIGHWEGGTLVIDTVERTAGAFVAIPHFLSPDLSEQAHFIERIRRVDANTLQSEVTIEDASRLAHPWTVTLRYRRVSNMNRLIATNCTENDRNPVVNGKVTIAPR